jgi:hypothetical protein
MGTQKALSKQKHKSQRITAFIMNDKFDALRLMCLSATPHSFVSPFILLEVFPSTPICPSRLSVRE